MATSLNPTISSLVERQMRNWEIAKSLRVETPLPKIETTHDFVTISRLAASGGSEIAYRLGERLAWPVFDRNILHVMADDDVARKRLYESMDEQDINWIHEFVQSMQVHDKPPSDYFQRLCKTMLAIVRQSPAIVLGRGGSLILPRQCGLRVRITAPIDVRVQRYAQARNVDAKQARSELRTIDDTRARFIKTHFATVPSDVDRYDLIINTRKLSIDAAIETIVAAIKAKE